MFKFPSVLRVIDHPAYGTKSASLVCETEVRGHYLIRFRNGEQTLIHKDYLYLIRKGASKYAKER